MIIILQNVQENNFGFPRQSFSYNTLRAHALCLRPFSRYGDALFPTFNHALVIETILPRVLYVYTTRIIYNDNIDNNYRNCQ